MRNIKKYKNLPFLKLNSYKFRLLKFKRTKWKKVLFFYKFFYLKKCFMNHKSILVKFKSWSRLSKQYKNFMLLKKMYKHRFSGLNLINCNKKNLVEKYKNIYLVNYILETMLFNIGFCTSVDEAQILIKTKKIVLNNQTICTLKKVLKKGDIIFINSKIKFNNSFYSFNIYHNIVEIDFYNQMFIVIKDFDDLKSSDLSLMFSDNYYKLV